MKGNKKGDSPRINDMRSNFDDDQEEENEV